MYSENKTKLYYQFVSFPPKCLHSLLSVEQQQCRAGLHGEGIYKIKLTRNDNQGVQLYTEQGCANCITQDLFKRQETSPGSLLLPGLTASGDQQGLLDLFGLYTPLLFFNNL